MPLKSSWIGGRCTSLIIDANTHIGSSSGMECKGALSFWEQSVEKYKLCYTSLIADGDSKTYNLITEKHIQPHNEKETTYNLIKE